MGDAGFKHITVNAAEDDDVVIRAGVSYSDSDASGSGDAHDVAVVEPEACSPTVRSPLPADAQDAPAPRGSQVEDARTEGVAAVEPAQRPSRVHSEGEPAGARASSQGTRPKDADVYRDPTLEDLNAGPMPIAQKVVIIAAVVCIIGALVYYFGIMG